ncbi:EthD family reductase [Novosphingobium sp. 9]|uniref:EthD family reductase n=1 Tax=Novosphingobium sp. 9 TaxID=2025349 RepID=UPI0021B5BA50|nr:EthD family reductase [Novosphingobium sp. 9]
MPSPVQPSPALIVTYLTHDGAHFDRAYYDEHHMGLAREVWGAHGLTGTEVFYPTDPAQPYACISVLRFRDEAAMAAALADAGTAKLVADVANFTDIVPLNYTAAS